MNLEKLIRAQRPNIKDNSLNNYLISLKKLNDNKTPKNLDFLKNKKKTIENVRKQGDKELSLTSQKNRLTAILVALNIKNDIEEFKTLKEFYLKELDKLNEEYINNVRNKKSEKEEKNWCKLKELKKVSSTYKKQINDLDLKERQKPLTPKQKDLLQLYLLSLLYTLIPPMRLDYNVIIKSNEKDLNKNENYLINKSKFKKYFLIQDYKTSESNGSKKIDLPKEIVSAINLWLRFNKTGFLFINNRNERQSENGLGKMITKAFSPTGKNVSLNLLRKIFVSENINKTELNKAEKLADDMGHSVSTQQLVYHKD